MAYDPFRAKNLRLNTWVHKMQCEVLKDAARTWQGRPTHIPLRRGGSPATDQWKHRIKRDTVHAMDVATWLHASDADRPFAFQSICESIGLDPQRTRDAILTGRRWSPRVPPAESIEKRRCTIRKKRKEPL